MQSQQRPPQGAGQVHRPAVDTDDKASPSQQADQLQQRGGIDQIDHRLRQRPRRRLIGAPNHHNRKVPPHLSHGHHSLPPQRLARPPRKRMQHHKPFHRPSRSHLPRRQPVASYRCGRITPRLQSTHQTQIPINRVTHPRLPLRRPDARRMKKPRTLPGIIQPEDAPSPAAAGQPSAPQQPLKIQRQSDL